jgi:hypothetical protein
MSGGAATATATTTGGVGGGLFGISFGISPGNGGNGTASATATSGGPATATATATGGAGGTTPVAPGITGVDGKGDATASATTGGGAKAQSLATATGSTAQAKSTSETSVGETVKTVASSSTDSTATTNAIVQAGGGGQSLVNPGQSAYAFATGLPTKSYSTALIGGATHVADALLGSRDVVFGTSVLGANLSGDGSTTDTYSASSTFDFAYRGDLVLGLIAPLDGSPTDFRQIDFTVTLDGTKVLDRSFTSLAAADVFFADDALNLGSVSGVADVVFSYDLVAGGAGGYGMDLAFGGAVPEPSTWAMMLIGFAGVGYAAMRRAGKGGSTLANR